MTPEALEAASVHGLTAEETRAALMELRNFKAPRNHIEPTALIHPTAVIWHYAVILQDVMIEAGVSIGSHTEIGRGSHIGERSRIGSGVFLPPHSVIGKDTFIGPHVACADDRYPYVRGEKSGQYSAEPPIIGDHVAIGLGAVLLPGVCIGDGARIGAGAIVTRNVPAGGFVRCEPAREHELSPEAREWMEMLVGPMLGGEQPDSPLNVQ